MASDPKPDKIRASFQPDSPEVDAHPRRPIPSRLFEMKRRVMRIILEQRETRVCGLLNLNREICVSAPEFWVGAVPHQSVQRPSEPVLKTGGVLRQVFWPQPSLARPSKPAEGILRPRRLVCGQNPSPRNPSYFSDRLSDRSRNASSPRASRRPAAASASNCRSQASPSKSANQLRNAESPTTVGLYRMDQPPPSVNLGVERKHPRRTYPCRRNS